MAENQVYLIKSGQNSFVEETEAIVGISGGKVGIGTTAPEADLHVTGDVKIGGDLAVDGTFTTINSSTISVDDKNIELGSTDNPTDVTADGGGITVKGTTDKTFNWIDATDAWTSSEHLHLAAGKNFAADAIRALGAGGLNIGDDAGNGIFVQDGGKVGIATTNPGYDLDVDGSGNFASLYVDGNAVLTGEGSIFGKWEDGAAQGEIFYTGGNVGVGTNNPEYPLHVVGNSVVDGNFVVNGTSGNFNVSDFNVSGDSIVLNYGGGSLTSNRGGIIVKDSSFANKTFEYVEGSDYWNSNVGLNITNGGINVASVSAVDANGLTLGDDAGNGIFVEDGGQIGINTTNPGYNLHVNGSTHVGGEFSVGNEFKISAGGAIGGTAPASDGDIIKWDDANNKWVAGANVGGGGGGGVGEVPLATINSLPSGQSIYEIEFAETYNVEPRIATQLEIDGEGSIIPYVVSGVSTSGYHLIFAQDIPNNNYRIHTTFGGRDVHWETGAGASLYYNDGDVSIQRNFTIGGNLTVNGTTTTVNTETVEIEDHNLVIAANTGYNQLDSQYPAGGAYAGILWGTGDAGAASPVSLTYQTNKGFSFAGGKLGVGVAAPAGELHVFGSNSAKVIIEDDSDTEPTLEFRGNNASARISTISGDALGDNLVFYNRKSSGSLTESLRIDDDGNVGIGTTNPGYELSVSSSDTTSVDIRAGTNSNSSRILFSDSDAVGVGAVVYNHSNDSLYFNTTNNTNVLIDSNGNVGIGTTNPSDELTISATSPAVRLIDTSDSSYGTLAYNASYLSFNADGGNSVDNSGIQFNVDSSEKMRITSGGNVGIGTTNPGGKLHVNTSNTLISGTVSIVDGSTLTASGSKFLLELSEGDSLKIDGGSTYTVVSITSNTEVELNSNITAGGGESLYRVNTKELLYVNEKTQSVGIGTTNPQHILDVRSSEDLTTFANNQTPGVGIKNEDQSVNNVALLAFKASQANTVLAGVGMINRAVTTASGSSFGDLGFYVKPPGNGNLNDNPSMIITSGGNVGIGTTNPDNLLHVQRNTTSNAYAVIENTTVGNAGINLKNASGDWNIVANADLRFIDNAVGAGDRMRIDSAGNVGIGTTSPGTRLTIKSSAVSSTDSAFSIVSAANSSEPIIKIAEKSTEGCRFHMYDGGVEKIAFYTDGTNNFINAGNVGIGTTNPAGFRLNVQSNSDTVPIKGYRATATATSYLMVLNSNIGTGSDVVKFRVEADGDVISATNSYTSDERAKTEISDLNYGVDTINQLQPKQFKMLNSEEKGFKYGFVAQEIETVLPDLVREDGVDDGEGGSYKALEYNSIIAVLTKAIQEQQSIIESLQSQNASLESRISALES